MRKGFLNLDNQINFVQESRLRTFISKLYNEKMLKNICFSNFFQLLPVWVMLLIQLVSEYSFQIEEYISNLLVFTVVACAANLSDLFGTNNLKEKVMPVTLFILVLIMCFASIMYCLLLLYDQIHLKIKMETSLFFSVVFTLGVVLLNIWQTARKDV